MKAYNNWQIATNGYPFLVKKKLMSNLQLQNKLNLKKFKSYYAENIINRF